MKSILFVLMIIAIVAVFLVLAVGVFGMFRNTEFNRKYGNVLMRARVATQLIAIVLIALYLFIK